MKFFYADSLDLVDPHFDFVAEKSRNVTRIPQRDDVYAHQLMPDQRPYDGLLVSKALFRVGGPSVATGKYSQAQRKRFERSGAPSFLRFPKSGESDSERFPILGDCGAFAYRNEPAPPFTVDELVDFYEDGRFSMGISLDHVVMEYDESLDREDPTQASLPGVKSKHSRIREGAMYRQALSLSNAAEFREKVLGRRTPFEPLGAAHGWSPASYRHAARQLVKMGYEYIAIGGLVPRKNPEIEAILRAVRPETLGHARLHLLGVVRPELYGLMRESGVVSFDSSSPIWQAFKDAKDNYYSGDPDGHYTAIRVPQSDKGVPMRRIREGRIDQHVAVAAERAALEALRAYDRRELDLRGLLEALHGYDDLLGDDRKTKTPWTRMERTLQDRPWEVCACPVCKEIGIEVIIFRGANRNRRRGFHNLAWTQRTLEHWREGAEA